MIEIAEYTVSMGLNGAIYLVDNETRQTMNIRRGVAKQISEAIDFMSVRGERRERILALEAELQKLRQEEQQELEMIRVPA